jgi:hypothetical protein
VFRSWRIQAIYPILLLMWNFFSVRSNVVLVVYSTGLWVCKVLARFLRFPVFFIFLCACLVMRSVGQLQCPRGLRYEPFSPARILVSWVRIPLEACVCVYSVFVLFCVYVAALRRAGPSSMKSCRLCRN